MLSHDIKIIDLTANDLYERLLYRCLAPMPFRKYKRRNEYLKTAIPRGFHKKVLYLNGEAVGQIEYAPPEASGYPIIGKDIIVMNCIWVLRKAKGRHLGIYLLKHMRESEKAADGFATISLENHWSGWLKKEHFEMLGFKSIDSITVVHKTKHKGEPFKIHLMWLPRKKDAKPPTWDKSKILEGVNFCLAHPLYHPEKLEAKEILESL